MKHLLSIFSFMLAMSVNQAAFSTVLNASDSTGLRSFDSGATVIELTFERAFGGTEDRTITHFDISGLSGTVTNASLDLSVYSLDPGGVLELYSFDGDGTVSVDEWDLGSLIHSFTSISQYTYQDLSLDITSLLQDYIDAGSDYLSFNFRGPGSRIDLGDSGAGTAPTVINYELASVPEPFTLGLLLTGIFALFLVKRTNT